MSKKSLQRNKYYSEADRLVHVRMQREVEQVERTAYDKGFRHGYNFAFLSLGIIFIVVIIINIINIWSAR